MRRPWARLALSERLLVNLRSGDAIGGILRAQEGNVLVIADARVFQTDGPGEGRPVDGEILVELGNVSFAQRLAPRNG